MKLWSAQLFSITFLINNIQHQNNYKYNKKYNKYRYTLMHKHWNIIVKSGLNCNIIRPKQSPNENECTHCILIILYSLLFEQGKCKINASSRCLGEEIAQLNLKRLINLKYCKVSRFTTIWHHQIEKVEDKWISEKS